MILLFGSRIRKNAFKGEKRLQSSVHLNLLYLKYYPEVYWSEFENDVKEDHLVWNRNDHQGQVWEAIDGNMIMSLFYSYYVVNLVGRLSDIKFLHHCWLVNFHILWNRNTATFGTKINVIKQCL